MRSARTTALALIAALTGAAGCKNDAPAGGFAPPPSPSVASGEAPAVTPPAPPVDPSAVPASAAGPAERIFEQLAKEKADRPGGTPTAEAVLAAIAQAGVTFDETKQVLAATAGARYCLLAQNTKTGLRVVVCEYASADAAEQAKRGLIEKFQKIAPTRTFAIKGATSVQVVDRADQPLPDARRQIDAALATL